MKVSKSGFYEYLGRKKSNAQIEREALEGFVVEAFERHKGRYGCRRIDRELRKSGIVVSEKRVLRIMRKLGLAGKGATRKRRIQKKVEPGDPRLNLVERAFAVGGRNRIRAGGIACMPAMFVASKKLTKRHVAFEHYGRHVLHYIFALPSIKAASMRWLAPLNSTSLPWWTILSIMAEASLSSPRTVPHFENSMFVVNIMLRLS